MPGRTRRRRSSPRDRGPWSGRAGPGLLPAARRTRFPRCGTSRALPARPGPRSPDSSWAAAPWWNFGSSAPHATQASRDIHPDALARASRRELSLGFRPGGPFEESEQLVGNKAGARGIDMAVALRVLRVDEEALRSHEMQIVPGTRHRDIEEAPFLLDLRRAAGAEVRRNAPIDDV